MKRNHCLDIFVCFSVSVWLSTHVSQFIFKQKRLIWESLATCVCPCFVIIAQMTLMSNGLLCLLGCIRSVCSGVTEVKGS